MKKYFIVTLFTALLLTSCGKKAEEKTTTSTSSTTTIETSTSKTEEVKKEETATAKVETSTSSTEETKTESNSDVKVYRNTEKGYEVTYKNNPDYKVSENQDRLDLMIALQTGENMNITSEDFSAAPISTTKEYVDASITNLKNLLNAKDLKSEEITLNGNKGYKVTYSLDMQGQSLLIEQLIFTNDKKVAVILTRT